MVTFILLVVGGLNWGLTALNYNLVEMLLGSWPMLVQAVYLLVGLSAVYEIVDELNNSTETINKENCYFICEKVIK